MTAAYKNSSLYRKFRAFRIAANLPYFLLKRRLFGFDVPSTPHFDSAETTRWFSERLAKAKMYLEYGAGGSTCLAAKNGVRFVSVDSDPYFLESVRKKIIASQQYRPDEQVFHHADIGLTGGWGKPVLWGLPSDERLESFRRYSDIPAEIGTKFPLPDLVLVDGRFRVACALKALRALQHEQGWLLLVDDYRGRQGYQVIAEFGRLQTYVGRMAVFDGIREDRLGELDAAIRQYETVSS